MTAMIGIKVSHVNLEYGRNRIALAIETATLIAIRVDAGDVLPYEIWGVLRPAGESVILKLSASPS